jgi:signal transduction histidine kinase
MRTLLLELRPATLTESSLPDLLRQLTEAVVGRSRFPVELEIEGEGALPPDVQVAFYRIAQESLNNITKHAAANRVTVHLTFATTAVILSISDDGRGFDPGGITTESLGLGIMRERAAQIGARLEIASRPGSGTTITAVWPANTSEDL